MTGRLRPGSPVLLYSTSGWVSGYVYVGLAPACAFSRAYGRQVFLWDPRDGARPTIAECVRRRALGVPEQPAWEAARCDVRLDVAAVLGPLPPPVYTAGTLAARRDDE